MIKNWKENKDYCSKLCNENKGFLMKRETKGGFSGEYLTWTLVHKWFLTRYDGDFEIKEIKTSNDGSTGYVICSLSIFGEVVNGEVQYFKRPLKETLALTLETFKRANGEFYQETPEQLQMRVKVKLIANMTGFGFHLWEKH